MNWFSSLRFRLILLVVLAVIPLVGSILLFKTSLWELGLAGILTLSFTYIWGEFFIQRRLKKLIQSTKQIAEGNLTVRCGPPYGKDELSQLGRAFDQMAESLEKQQKHLLQQERLRALGQMASGIAHDFNNALTSILGFSELMLEQPEMLGKKEMTVKFLQKINIAAKDAGNIVRRLREFYREREEGENFLPVDLNGLVEQTISLTEPKWKAQAQAANKDIKIASRLEPLPKISGNESELREVLTNLIFNAVDAIPHGGTITFLTRMEKDLAVLEIKDTGSGMSQEVRQHCFEPFFTTKGNRGSGLGLAMVYGVVQRHNGTIEIESEPGKGTAFVIHFPLSNETQKEAAQAQAHKSSQANLHILVIEDEQPVREVITQYLCHDGHHVVAAADGEAALKEFEVGRFDLVISDGGLPGISGERLVSQLKKASPALPVIMLTGYADYLRENGQKLEGIDLILSKPISMATLREAIAKVVAPSSKAA